MLELTLFLWQSYLLEFSYVVDRNVGVLRVTLVTLHYVIKS